MRNEHGLIAPPSFWALPEAEINRKYAGCGPGKIGDIIIPDYFWGLGVRLAWQIHDHEYEVGLTVKDKVDADCRLLHNLYILIENEPMTWLTGLRLNRAECYYEMVSSFGNGSFKSNKQALA